MPRRGTPTEVPGVTRDGTTWIVRALWKGPTGRRWEKQKRIEGASDKPTHRELVMLEDEIEKLRAELKAEAEAEAKGLPSLDETVGGFAPRWFEYTAKTGKTRKHVVEKRLYQLDELACRTSARNSCASCAARTSPSG